MSLNVMLKPIPSKAFQTMQQNLKLENDESNQDSKLLDGLGFRLNQFSAHPLSKKELGQEFHFNPLSKVLIMEMKEPFYWAGKLLSWDPEKFSIEGFGFNHQIVKIIRKYKATLLIRYNGKEFWLNYSGLEHFLRNYRTEYTVKGDIVLNVFPWSIFKPKPVFDGGE